MINYNNGPQTPILLIKAPYIVVMVVDVEGGGFIGRCARSTSISWSVLALAAKVGVAAPAAEAAGAEEAEPEAAGAVEVAVPSSSSSPSLKKFPLAHLERLFLVSQGRPARRLWDFLQTGLEDVGGSFKGFLKGVYKGSVIGFHGIGALISTLLFLGFLSSVLSRSIRFRV